MSFRTFTLQRWSRLKKLDTALLAVLELSGDKLNIIIGEMAELV